MLAKSNRISRSDFSHYFKTGKRLHSPFATLIVSPYKTFHGSVVVSKKVNKKAVRRNKLRRRVYSQLYRAGKNKRTGVFIVILKPSFDTLPKSTQHTEIEKLIELAPQTTYNTAHV
jgi:ribonuclease P protein component